LIDKKVVFVNFLRNENLIISSFPPLLGGEGPGVRSKMGSYLIFLSQSGKEKKFTDVTHGAEILWILRCKNLDKALRECILFRIRRTMASGP
jgi:hypothetical protein